MTDKSRYVNPSGSSVESEDRNKIEAATNFIFSKNTTGIIFGILLFFFLYVVSRYNYLLFHTLAELFSIAVAWSLFIVVWNSRHLSNNRAFVFIGIAYLFIGSIDLVHTLSYRGMGVIAQEWGSNTATQLWIAARFMESISFVIFPIIFFKKIRYSIVWSAYFVITALIFITIFYWKIFPDCYIEGVGLTIFKKSSEYIICLILFIAWALLSQRKSNVDRVVYRLLVFSIVLTIFQEFVFTFYISVYGISNFIGHYIKILSFLLIYIALVRTSLKKPYETLFRELNTSEVKFKALFEGMISGIALHEIICDKEGNPIDYRFLDINSAFEKMTGLHKKDLIGKTVLQVLPKTEPYWIETYGRVALTGNSVQFEDYSIQFKKHFEVSAYSLKFGQFVVVFNDITDQKNSEVEKDKLIDEKDKLIGELKKSMNEIKTLRGILPICSHCKKIRDDKGSWKQIEEYIRDHSEAEFSHGICQECAKKYYPEMDLYADKKT
ncbi:PAS domain S-box protein [Desulforhopalus vacuolatus]|uniref:MASE3 domain-containing protein n=1 Tax=Desulforhopalus vacuolatus TaxID=40414 RepID=UPI001963EB91|nr:MASE3 domain-containing protein [Desulforhopalus vacuolatus]MBM9519176.1 PAS domain S-box protein [Desulforhopalus vacuolatus]